MNEFFILNWTGIRIFFFVTTLIVMGIFEDYFPRRKLSVNKTQRWKSNLSLIFLNSLLLRIFLPISGISLAFFLQNKNIGLFNIIKLPQYIELILSLLILDFAIYYQHKIFHSYKILWRLHKIHHTDLDIDTTTGIRFHPIEIIISMMLKLIIITIFGISAVAFFVFEIILNSASLFNHSNVNIPVRLDKFLRIFLVTPDMHRVHHSVIRKETNSNYGFSVPWWDYLVKTYIRQPKEGHEKMSIGLKEYREEKKLGLLSLLIIPFQNSK